MTTATCGKPAAWACDYRWVGRPVRIRVRETGPVCCVCGAVLARGTLAEVRTVNGVPHQRHAAGTCDHPDVDTTSLPRRKGAHL